MGQLLNKKRRKIDIRTETLELQRYIAILFATIGYLEQHLVGSIVTDGYDPAKEYYQQQKLQTEKYFQQGRLDRLRKQLARLTKQMQISADLVFASYIKEKTGYDIDIFKDLRKRVDAIVAQNKIRNQSELNDVGRMLHYYYKMAPGGKDYEKLKLLLTEYSKRTNEAPQKTQGGYPEVIRRVEKGSIEEVTVRMFSGPKPKHYNEKEESSPDGKLKLRIVQWGSGRHASTYVALDFASATTAVYGLSGICHDVKAWWRDNSTIIIETRKDYMANIQCMEVRSFNDAISVEYVVA